MTAQRKCRPAFYAVVDMFKNPPTLCRRGYDSFDREWVGFVVEELNEVYGRPRYAPAAVFHDGRVEELKS